MMTALLAAVWLLWAAGFLLLPMLRGSRHKAPGKPRHDRVAGTVSVIIPARNEAHNLPALLDSLAAQSPPPAEVIVVDDASTDGTSEVARRHGATVVSPPPLPDGWRGKPWACHQGAASASGDLLCFMDADTRLATPHGLALLLDAWPGGAFSLCPWHEVRRPYEQLSLFFNLMMVLGTVPHGLFGPLLLIDRSSYRKAGGHERVRDRILENHQLAVHCREAGVPASSAAGRGVVSFRMYPGGLRDLIEGWTKGFSSGAGRTPGGRMFLLIAWLTGLMAAWIGLAATGFSLPWLALWLACAAQVLLFARRVGSFHWLTAVFYPLPLVFFLILFTRSARRSGKHVTWKGREIRAD